MNLAVVTLLLAFLGAAIAVVPLARKLGLGSVLGYLMAGVLIGPWCLGLVVEEGQTVMHVAEFGVVMMLFLVGLELEPERLWHLRGPIFGLGGLQVSLTAAVVGAGAWAVGLPPSQAVAVGLVAAMSSTAIGLQSLGERGLLRSDAGQKSFAILLFQDIAVIPVLAAFPLLADPHLLHADEHHDAGHAATSLIAAWPAWAQGLAVLAAVGLVVLTGRHVVHPAMVFVARSHLRELFTMSALALVLAVTFVMTLVGLSPALGAFVAGVVLAGSEFRHQLESDIEPFKALLLGLFFMAVGASIDFGAVVERPGVVFGGLAGLVVAKAVVLLALGRLFGASPRQSALLTATLTQVGEFAFVLLGFAQQSAVLPASVTTPLVAITALSMALSPLFLLVWERAAGTDLVGPGAARDADAMDEENPVIIAGYGRFGQICGRFLRSSGVSATVLDVDSDQVELLRRFHQKVYYGDASRLDLLRAAGAERARLLIVAVDDHTKVLEIVDVAREHFPQLTILARARGRVECYDLLDRGVQNVYRETYDSSLRVGVDAMRLLGLGAHRAERLARIFRRHDDAAVRDMAALRDDEDRLVAGARAALSALDAAMQVDRAEREDLEDSGWELPQGRRDA